MLPNAWRITGQSPCRGERPRTIASELAYKGRWLLCAAVWPIVYYRASSGREPDGYPSWVSSTTAIRVPITPVAAAARGPATNFATATQAVTIAAAPRRTMTGELTWDGEFRLTMMPTATIATMSTRETSQSLLLSGCVGIVTGTRPFEHCTSRVADKGPPGTAACARPG